MLDSGTSKLAAWGIHLLTASGAVIALLALLAINRGDLQFALLWLFAALAIDAVDGTMARAVRVRDVVPRIDGEALDLIVDYLNYVLIPAWFIIEARYLPSELSLPLTAAILLSSLYVFARRDMKTDDGYFRGFPALWNVVAFYVLALEPSPAVAAGSIAMLVGMTFAPVHVIHPFRAREFWPLGPILALVWTVSTLGILIPAFVPKTIFVFASLACATALVALGLLRTVRGPA